MAKKLKEVIEKLKKATTTEEVLQEILDVLIDHQKRMERLEEVVGTRKGE